MRSAGPVLTAVLGPTNTGKTHLAIERMCGHVSGMIGFPLRLLAREVYERVVAVKGAAQVALITGEEKILPPGARYYLCTAESMPADREVAFLAIDEAQMGADRERGHVFTERLLHARGFAETMILGSESLRPVIGALLPDADIVTRPRFSTLSYAGAKKLSRLPRRSAIVAFSTEEVYALAEMLRRHKGGAAVVMGALSPRTRNAQVALFQAGEVDYLVATDAIGMGLNLDLAHVAFASLAKFDGHRRRRLAVSEMAQIAGRAGRHQRDGTFGLVHLGESADHMFDAEEIAAIEEHRFPPVERLEWRNPRLDWGSLSRLIASLEELPRSPVLHRAEQGTDLSTLKLLAAEEWVAQRARNPAMLRRLWDVCGLPDFRKTGGDTHSRLIGQMYRHLSEGAGHLPVDWIAREVARLDNRQGDIATLSDRIAGARTWTYVAHRADWLAAPAEWAERTRALEDGLSDALHEGLMSRFVDRRISVLIRKLGGRAGSLAATVDDDGTVAVEGEGIGRLDGFRFEVDATARLAEKRMLLAAAEKHLPHELRRRARLLVAAEDTEIALGTAADRPPALEWNGHCVARLVRGTSVLVPGIRLDPGLAALPAAERRTVEQRLRYWMERTTMRQLSGLTRLAAAAAKDGMLTGPARGLARRMVDRLGAVPRDEAIDLLDVLDPPARQAMKKLGVRFGPLDLFSPALLKPEATRWRAALWAAEAGRAMPRLPKPGATTLAAADCEDAVLALAGFRVVGGQAVRIDIVDRLADAAHGARDGRQAFVPDPALGLSMGLSPETLRRLMRLIGFVPAGDGGDGYVWRGARRPRRADAAPAPGRETPFSVLAALRAPRG
jgi:ATP-dependent RNA helicase SUPV3L1/SUV3